MKWKASIRKIFINGEKRELYLKVFNGIPEAPADGEQYVRKNRFWRKLEGAIDIDTEVTETSENPVKSSGIWAFVTTQIDAVKNWATNLFLKKSDFDDQYFSGEGTDVDPKSLRMENIADDVVSIKGLEPESITINRNLQNEVISIDYENGNELILNRSLGEITGFEDDNYIWTINKTNNIITGITVTKK